jgi:hypothetical protein
MQGMQPLNKLLSFLKPLGIYSVYSAAVSLYLFQVFRLFLCQYLSTQPICAMPDAGQSQPKTSMKGASVS